ncbi:uncharacterized protein LOC113503446 isoform X2 [Trichoplusia ni]|uniref:Uncharacterized protein LOC113503446 isoform X2 n=1 Tax=Trichoplusia ni TaxID=7111 RepID=A0A7E5WKK5_TRINI|nr:uncharacterized protein LOC113503446 isoform X2 [Trichoplusia ni]
MELMSSLLLYALVAHLPQALANHIKPRPSDLDIKFNNSMIFHQMPMPKKILLNINGPPLVNMVNDLQVVFMDVNCKKCIDCMERAIKAYKTHYHIVKQRPRTDELHQEVLKNRYGKGKRIKRESRSKKETETATTTSKTRKGKPKKKTVSVTKYNVDGEVYAVKVNETSNQVNIEHQNDTLVSTCQLFSVTKTALCDTPEAFSVLLPPKRKTVKKKSTKTYRPRTPEPHFMIPSFRKRQVDNTQEPDNFMSSIEESY